VSALKCWGIGVKIHQNHSSASYRRCLVICAEFQCSANVYVPFQALLRGYEIFRRGLPVHLRASFVVCYGNGSGSFPLRFRTWIDQLNLQLRTLCPFRAWHGLQARLERQLNPIASWSDL
jgi:hypothetical protein